MQEYASNVLVLVSEPQRETDLRLQIFTEKFGKVSARARSGRKVTSKLAPHLQPGFFARVRLVEKGGVQVVDALKIEKSNIGIGDLVHLAELLPAFQPEEELWGLVRRSGFSWLNALRILGWDPTSARCTNCGAARPAYFRTRDQEFFCEECALKLGQNNLIYIERGK